jgi:hypothetical protein
MFGNLGLHVIHNPAGTFSFVGSLPIEMATMFPATKSDVMAGRAIRNNSGELVCPKWPCFASRFDAVAFAQDAGFTVT